MRTHRWSAVAIALCCLVLGLPFMAVRAQDIPPLASVSSTLPLPEQETFRRQKLGLDAEYQRFKIASDSFNLKSANDQSDEEYSRLQAERDRYIRAANAFNSAMALRIAAANEHRVIELMRSYARQLDWTEEKQVRLVATLGDLGFDGDPNSTSVQVRQAWTQVLARDAAALAGEAGRGVGPGLPGAGLQTGFNDCAIFALAYATGRPYGVIAAAAADLVRDGNWRTATERTDPQRTIESGGLNGGEVIMLAEAFGEAKVVPGSAFPSVLGEGRPVLVNVVPEDGDLDEGHEVVLTRVFQHGGETWYEMLDSNQGPLRRLYLSAGELSTIQLENGVVFNAEAGRTPALLRTREAQ